MCCLPQMKLHNHGSSIKQPTPSMIEPLKRTLPKSLKNFRCNYVKVLPLVIKIPTWFLLTVIQALVPIWKFPNQSALVNSRFWRRFLNIPPSEWTLIKNVRRRLDRKNQRDYCRLIILRILEIKFSRSHNFCVIFNSENIFISKMKIF